MKKLLVLLTFLLVLQTVSFGVYEYYSGGYYRAKITYQAQSSRAIVVMYTASWCPACRHVRPLLEALDKAGFMKLIIVDVDAQPKEEEKYGSVGFYIPRITVYRRWKTPNGLYWKTGLIYQGTFPGLEKFEEMLFYGSNIEPQDVTKAVGSWK